MRGKANEGRTLAFGTAGSGLVDDFGGRASENGTGLFGADQPAGRALAAHARVVADGLLALGQPPAVEDTICSETDREKGKQSIDLVMAASGNDGRGRGGGLLVVGGLQQVLAFIFQQPIAFFCCPYTSIFSSAAHRRRRKHTR